MGKISKEEMERLEELRKSLIEENGDYRQDADIDDLKELARLEALADGQREPKTIKDGEEKEEAKKEGDSPAARIKKSMVKEPIRAKSKVPKNVKPWTERGCVYCGVDKDGIHILHNKDEGMFYRLNRNNPNFVDALGDGLPRDYLESLK